MQGPEQAPFEVRGGWPRRLWSSVLDVVLPPRCLGCGDGVDRQGALCAACWSELSFITPPLCRICGLPLPYAAVGDGLCEPCLDEPPVYDMARAALRYDGIARRLILGFKHGERIEAARTLATWMAQAAGSLLEAEVVAPVPLHRWRLLKRGYNQSALLAGLIAASAGLRFAPALLIKKHATRSQQGLGAGDRRHNVTAALFAPGRHQTGMIEGRRILLVDDVLTTGATANACAQALGRAGAASVNVLTLARVASTADDPI